MSVFHWKRIALSVADRQCVVLRHSVNRGMDTGTMATELLLLIGTVIYLWGSLTSTPSDRDSRRASEEQRAFDQRPGGSDESLDNTGTSI